MNGDFEHAYFPVSLDLDGRLAVVIGGGMSAEEHVLSLMRYGADILVVAQEVSAGIDELVAQGAIEHEQRDYVRGDLGGAFLVICATPSVETCRAVYQEAEGRGCLVSSVHVPELCNFIMPAVVERGLLQVSVSTAGASPEVAEQLQEWLDGEFGPEWVYYVRLLGQARRIALDRIADRERRDDVLRELANAPLRDRIVAGERPTAEDVFREIMLGAEDERPETGPAGAAPTVEPATSGA